MNKRISLTLTLGITAIASAALFAEGGSDDIFLGPRVWTDPAPATYQLQITGTNLCAQRTSGGSIIRKPYLSLQTCNAGIFSQLLQFAPKQVAPPAIPLTSNVRWRMTTANECASVARGVVFGPAAVDMLPCDMPALANGNTSLRGAADQGFILFMRGRDRLNIRYTDGKCWTAQGNNLTVGTQLVMEPCDGRASQTFTMVFQDDVDEAANTASAQLFGWFVPSLALSPGASAARFRSMRKLDIMGGDYDPAHTSTPNDQGAACAKRCIEDNRCRAFTWVDPRLAGGQAKCFVKDQINEPTNNAMTNSGIVRPR